MAASANPTRKSPHPLRIRDFRLLWLGESISLLGDQFYIIALPWLVLQLTGNALALGAITALATVPRALLMLVGGALVDRLSPRAVMFASNFARMILVALLAVLVLTNALQLWMLYFFAVIYGSASAFYFPAENAMIPKLLQPDQLQMGNTLSNGVATLSMFVGPALAGVLIVALGGTADQPSVTGTGAAFALDALSFLASVITLWLMRPQAAAAAATPTRSVSVLAAIKEGMVYIRESPVLRIMFIQLVAMNLLTTGPMNVGIPVLAKGLPEGAAAYGLLMSTYGAGWLLGIVLAGVLPRPQPARFGPTLLAGMALVGVGILLLPLSHATPVVALVTFGMGAAMGYVNIHFMTYQQRRIPPHLMGRVMSLIIFASFGIQPLSSALAGAILTINPVALFVGAGAAMATLTCYFATLPIARQVGLEVEALEQERQAAALAKAELSASS